MDVVHVVSQDVVAPGAAAFGNGGRQAVGSGAPGIGSGLVDQQTSHGDALAGVSDVVFVMGEQTGSVADAAGLQHIVGSHGNSVLEGVIALQNHDGAHDLLVQHVCLADVGNLQSDDLGISGDLEAGCLGDDGSVLTDQSGVQLTVRDFGTEIFTPDDVTLLGKASVSDNENTSTGRCVGWISSENGGGIEFTVNTSEAGVYAVTIEYANNEEGGYHDYNVDLVERYISLFVNGEKKGNYFFRSTYSWDHFKTKTIMVELGEGENTLTLTNDGSYSFNNKVTYAPNIGSIAVNKVT